MSNRQFLHGRTKVADRSGSWVLSLMAAVGLCLFAAAAGRAETKQRQFWSLSSQGNDVYVYEAPSWKLIRKIEVGANPHGISATADGKTVHIALERFGKETGELVWVDAQSGEIKGRLEVGREPNENECTPDGKWIYVPCLDGKYWVIDGEKRSVATKIETGGRPHNTVVSPDGKRMYLSPMGSPHKVSIVDISAGHKVIGEIPFGNVTRPPAISSDEKLFFEQVDGLMGVEVADIAQKKVVHTMQHKLSEDLAKKPSRCHGLAVRPDQKEIWSCNVEHQLVHVHELTSGKYEETATIAMPGRVYWACFSPDGKYGFVSVRSTNQVAVIDCETKKIVTLLPAGKEPKRSQVIDVPQP